MFKKKMYYLLLLILVFVGFIYFSSKETYSIETLSLEEAQNSLVNTANAFKYRDKYFQYDDSALTYNNSNKRIPRNDIYITPEDITPQGIKYSSCSPFLFNVYYNAFTKNDNSGNFEIGYYNKSGNYVGTTNSNHFVLMANPYYNVGNSNYTNSYYDSEIAVYNLSLKVLNSGAGYSGKVAYSGDTTDYRGFSRTISTYQYGDGTLEKDKYAIVENIPGEDEIQVAIDGYQTADEFRHQLAEYLIDKIIDYAQVGDIIGYIYDNGNNSHVVMVSAIDKTARTMQLVHSFNGATYNYLTKKDKTADVSTFTTWNANNLKTGANYGFYRKDLAQVSIIRPLNRILNGNYKLSDSVKIRNSYPHLVMTKTASVNAYESVNLNQRITYTIKLKNMSNTDTYRNIQINDVVSNYTSYGGCNNSCIMTNNNITWSNISLAPGETKEYKYTLIVDNDTRLLGSFIVNNDTTVNGIKLNKIETQINKTLTKQMQNELINKVNEMIGEEVNSGYYGRHFIQDVYNDIGISGFNLKTYSTSQLLKMFYTLDTVNITSDSTINSRISAVDSGDMTRYTLKNTFDSNNSVYTNMYVKGLFGGVYVDSENYEANTVLAAAMQLVDGRNKTFRNDTLMVGDVLLLYDDDYVAETSGGDNQIPVYNVESMNAYLYLGNGTFATVMKNSSNKYVISVLENTTNANPGRLISSLIGQNAFIVLRPSYSYDEGIVIDDGDVNEDGVVSQEDAIILVLYIIEGTSEYDYQQLLIGDMNHDNIIKMNDVMLLLMQNSEGH